MNHPSSLRREGTEPRALPHPRSVYGPDGITVRTEASLGPRVPSTSMLILLLALGPALPAQKGYEWDHPDGLGVRYLLHRHLRVGKPVPEHDGPHLRARYIPKDERDWVKYKGTKWGWGVSVYEFPKDPASLQKIKDMPPARDFEEFLVRKDPAKSLYRYFTVEGKETAGESGTYRHWEYFDVFPGVAGEDRGFRSAGAGLFWAHDLGLGIKHRIAEGMYRWVRDTKAPPYRRSRYLVSTKHRVRVKGPPLPVSWTLDVLSFPSSASGQKGPASFEAVMAKKNLRRKILVRGKETKARKATYRLWRWFDDMRQGGKYQKATNYHGMAASYAVTGVGEVVLQVRLPSGDGPLDPKLEALGKKLVSSLHVFTDAEAKKALARPMRGFVSYKVAGCHRVDDREVVMVVRHPIIKGHKPSRSQLGRARKMVRSVSRAQ